jgi:hypothetical protein
VGGKPCVVLQAVQGLSAILDGGAREIQTVSSRTDPGHPITRGSFTLSFGEVCTFVIESVSVFAVLPLLHQVFV